MDPAGSFLVNSLETQLDPDGLAVLCLQIVKHLYHFRRKAVRACAYVESGDLRVGERLGKDASQIIRIAVSVGVGLEVGDVAAVLRRDGSRDLGVHSLPCFFDLLGDGAQGRRKVAGAAFGAEGAAAGRYFAVPVGAGAAGLKGEAIYFCTEAGAHGVVEGEVVHCGVLWLVGVLGNRIDCSLFDYYNMWGCGWAPVGAVTIR